MSTEPRLGKVVGFGRLSGGRMQWDDAHRMTDELREFGDVAVSVTVKPMTEAQVRSERANKYYWSTVLPPMVDYLDDGARPPKTSTTRCAPCFYLPNEKKRVAFINRVTGETLAVEAETRRSSTLGSRAFYEFVEKVRLVLRRALRCRDARSRPGILATSEGRMNTPIPERKPCPRCDAQTVLQDRTALIAFYVCPRGHELFVDIAKEPQA